MPMGPSIFALVVIVEAALEVAVEAIELDAITH
jgi:hypothetical protein